MSDEQEWHSKCWEFVCETCGADAPPTAPSVDVEKLLGLAGRLDACWRDLAADRGRHRAVVTIRSIADEIRALLDSTPSVTGAGAPGEDSQT